MGEETERRRAWDPSLYVQRANPQREVALNMLKDYLFKGNEKILDIGCGPGDITAVMAQKVPQGSVIGIDPDKPMITYAKKTYTDVKNLSFEEISATKIDFKQQFDLITSFNTLHWIEDQDSALTKAYNHLDSEGHFFVSMLHSTPISDPISQSLNKLIVHPEWQAYFNTFTPPFYLYGITGIEYENKLRTIGFKVNFFNENCYDIKFASIEALAQWFESWVPHAIRIPKDKRALFFGELAQSYVELSRQSGNTLSYYYYTWEFVAKK